MRRREVKGHLERRRRDGWIRQQKMTVSRSTGLQASSLFRHTQTYLQMHSDNPSALAKCYLIQPDLHSTEKANSLPLTVWKTERSSHKWQRSELPICVCVCVCLLACTCARTPRLIFLFSWWFFGESARVYTCIGADKLFSCTPFIVWQADSWAAPLPIVRGLSLNPACTASYTACMCVWDSLHFFFATSILI